jgi:membrane protease YdiL (CAAX protease family)
MEELPINTPTLYLDFLVLASVVNPSGFSYSLYMSWNHGPRAQITRLLALLALPFLVVIPAVWALNPRFWHSNLVGLHAIRTPLVVLALLLVPVAIFGEYIIHALAMYVREGTFPRKITLQSSWQQNLSPLDHILLVVVAIGEEFFYRLIWIGLLISFGVPSWLAVLISSLAYGLNHLFFGGTSVAAKTTTGVLYGALYLLGQSVWLPVVTHVLQNASLFAITRRRHA